MDEYAILAAMGGFIVVLLLISLALYLVDAFARYKYLKVRNYQNAWMGFIPFANFYACVEATYGPCNYINLFGWRAPAALIKLWEVAVIVLSYVVSYIPYVGGILSLVLTVLNVAVCVQIFRDMLERLDDPQTLGFGILATIISIVGSIKLLATTGNFAAASQDWMTDIRVLTSQQVLDGPLSFLNGSNNNNQGQQ